MKPRAADRASPFVPLVTPSSPNSQNTLLSLYCHNPSPPPLHRYVRFIESRLGVHVKWIGVGPGREAVVLKPLELPVGARS